MQKNKSSVFIHNGVEYFIQDEKYWKMRFGKRLNVRKRDFLKLKEKHDENLQRD